MVIGWRKYVMSCHVIMSQNILSCQEIGSPELKLRWQFQLYDCDRSGEGVRHRTHDDKVELISQEISTKKNLWKSFSRYLKEKKRKSRIRRKTTFICFYYNWFLLKGGKRGCYWESQRDVCRAGRQWRRRGVPRGVCWGLHAGWRFGQNVVGKLNQI